MNFYALFATNHYIWTKWSMHAVSWTPKWSKHLLIEIVLWQYAQTASLKRQNGKKVTHQKTLLKTQMSIYLIRKLLNGDCGTRTEMAFTKFYMVQVLVAWKHTHKLSTHIYLSGLNQLEKKINKHISINS